MNKHIPFGISFAFLMLLQVQPSSANIFKSIGHAVTHPGRTISGAAKDVGRIVTHPGRTARDIGHGYMTVARPVGRAVGAYYDSAGRLLRKVPVLKEAEPLARLGGKIARSKAGQIGFGLATGGALMAGNLAGAAAVGGGGAVAGYTLHKGYGTAKTEVKRVGNDLRR